MNAFGHLLEGVFNWVVQTSWQAAVLAGLILLAQSGLKKRLSPGWRYGLWLLLLARLLMPTVPQSALSIFNLTKSLPIQAPRTDLVTLPAPRETALPPIAPVANVPISAVTQPGSEPTVDLSAPASVPVPLQPTVAVSLSTKLDWNQVVLGLWLTGVGYFGASLLWTNWRFRVRLARHVEVNDESVISLLQECLKSYRLRESVRLVETTEVTSPAVYGFRHKWLLLPRGIFEQFSRPELRCIFLHELAHLKRGDLGVNFLVSVLQVIHWFNPILWFAWLRMRADRELATDALALARVGAGQEIPYGETILKVLTGFAAKPALTTLVGIVESKAQLAERLSAIARPGKPWKWTAAAVAMVIACVGLTRARTQPMEGVALKSFFAGLIPTTEIPNLERPATRPAVTNGPTLKVTVLDAETGEPVSKAEVLAPNQSGIWGTSENAPHWFTGTNGTVIVHLGELPDDPLQQIHWFSMSVRHSDYAPRGFSWLGKNNDARLGIKDDLTVRLKRGVAVGGMVIDEAGKPLPGIHVHLHGSAYWAGSRQEYPEYWSDSMDRSPVLTDQNGHWSANGFPKDLDYVVLTLSHPDGMSELFSYAPGLPGLPGTEQNSFLIQNPGKPLNLRDLIAGNLVLRHASGATVSGIVLDSSGIPLIGVSIKARSGSSHLRGPLEAKTDAHGKFSFSHVQSHQLMITASANDLAITSKVVDVSQTNDQIRIVLPPVQPLQIQVENGNGKPLAGAIVTKDFYRSEGHLLDYSGQTDLNGMVTWTNAPLGNFALLTTDPKSKVQQKIKVSPGQRRITFKLREGLATEIHVNARAHDPQTGVPVTLTSVRFQTADHEGFITGQREALGQDQLVISASQFRPFGAYPMFQLEVLANGYKRYVTEWRDFDEGDWSLDLALDRLQPSHRSLLLPDGSPADYATIWTRFETRSKLFIHSALGLLGQGLKQDHAGADGGFDIPDEPDEATVIFTHDRGFLSTTVAALKAKSTAQLHAFGSIEGVLRIAGKPVRGVKVHLLTRWRIGHADYAADLEDLTAADGSFIIKGIPEGDYRLFRLAERQHGNQIEDHPFPITIRPGEELKFDYSNPGRPVIGRAAVDHSNVSVDWQKDHQSLTLKLPNLPALAFGDYASVESFRAACEKVQSSDEYLKIIREARTYALAFSPDGSFRAEDVPPGTYLLRIEGDNALVPFVREIVVPPGDEPFDLGKLTLTAKEATAK